MNDLEKIARLIGLTFKNLRLKAGFKSYEHFAHQHNLSRIQYWKMENGNNFTLKSLLKLLDVHQLDLRSFLHLVEENEKIKATGPGARLQKLITYTQLSKKEFSLKIGYKTLTAVNKVLFKDQNIPSSMGEKIAQTFPEVNILWVMNQEGEMLKSKDKSL